MRRDVTIFWDSFDGVSHFQDCKTYEAVGTEAELADAEYLREEVTVMLMHDLDDPPRHGPCPAELSETGDWILPLDELGPINKEEDE